MNQIFETLDCSVVEAWSGIDQSHPVIQAIDDVISWKVPPFFHRLGRSGQLIPETPLTVETPNGKTYVIDQLKLKGIGLYDDQRQAHQPDPSVRFVQSDPHIGITGEGKFIMIPPSTGPMGGITMDRARMEYDVARTLFENNIPCEVPIRLYQYDNMSYEKNGEILPLAAVVSGQLQHGYDRLDAAFKYHTAPQELRLELEKYAKNKGFDISSYPEIAFLKSAYESYGVYLRQFSQVGFYRHSAHPSNLGFSTRMNDIYLTDIDSCRWLSECTEIARPMQVMRDALSTFSHLIIMFTEPRDIHRFPAEKVLEANLFRSYLKSYYYDISDTMIDGFVDIVERYYVKLHDEVLETYDDILKRREAASSEDTHQGRFQRYWKRVWINNEKHFSRLLAMFWVLHSESGMGEEYPFLLSEEEFYQNLAEFCTKETAEEIQKEIAKVTG